MDKFLDENGRMQWAKMKDADIIRYAKEEIAELRIESRSMLARVDYALYLTLLGRKCIDRVGLDRKKTGKKYKEGKK